jgi:hypothetical protein
MKFRDYLNITEIKETTSLKEWITRYSLLFEATTATRYSVEVNFRSNIKEVLDAFAKNSSCLP